MAQYVHKGDVVDYIATTTVSNGDLIALGARAVVAVGDGAAGEVVSVATRGVFDVPCTSQTIAVGADLYLADGKATTTKAQTGAVVLGVALTAATTSDTVVRVLIG